MLTVHSSEVGLLYKFLAIILSDRSLGGITE